jgi:hypothetical protein
MVNKDKQKRRLHCCEGIRTGGLDEAWRRVPTWTAGGIGIRAAAVLLVGMAASTVAAIGGEAAVDGRVVLERWVETKRLISRENQDWRTEQALLEDRIQLVRRETETLQETTTQVTGNIGEADRKLAELTASVDELKAATAGLGADIVRLEAGVRTLLARAPTPIVEHVKPLSQCIPKPGDETRVGLSVRFQNVIGILNEVNKFCREITVTSEVREQPDGGQAEVTVVYFGIARAYYCNAASGLAGIGRPGPEGWIWEPHNELAPAIAETIAIYRNEKPAGYILLPGGVE